MVVPYANLPTRVFVSDLEATIYGGVLLGQINAIPLGSDFRNEVFCSYLGTDEVKADEWYSYNDAVAALYHLRYELGPKSLLKLGTTIAEHALMPDGVQDLKTIIVNMDGIYKTNIRGRYLRGFHLLDFDEDKRTSLIEVHAPECPEFLIGIYMGFARRFPMNHLIHATVYADESKPDRTGSFDFFRIRINW